MSRYGKELLNLWVEDIERCGFIMEDGTATEVFNAHEDVRYGFRIRAEDLETYSPRIKATWHTHPNNNPNLSVPDYFLFCQLPQYDHVIIAQYSFRIYRAIGSRVLIIENDCI